MMKFPEINEKMRGAGDLICTIIMNLELARACGGMGGSVTFEECQEGLDGVDESTKEIVRLYLEGSIVPNEAIYLAMRLWSEE